MAVGEPADDENGAAKPRLPFDHVFHHNKYHADKETQYAQMADYNNQRVLWSTYKRESQRNMVAANWDVPRKQSKIRYVRTIAKIRLNTVIARYQNNPPPA